MLIKFLGYWERCLQQWSSSSLVNDGLASFWLLFQLFSLKGKTKQDILSELGGINTCPLAGKYSVKNESRWCYQIITAAAANAKRKEERAGTTALEMSGRLDDWHWELRISLYAASNIVDFVHHLCQASTHWYQAFLTETFIFSFMFLPLHSLWHWMMILKALLAAHTICQYRVPTDGIPADYSALLPSLEPSSVYQCHGLDGIRGIHPCIEQEFIMHCSPVTWWVSSLFYCLHPVSSWHYLVAKQWSDIACDPRR